MYLRAHIPSLEQCGILLSLQSISSVHSEIKSYTKTSEKLEKNDTI